MSTTTPDSVDRLRQHWMNIVEDVPSCQLPTASVSEQQEESSLNQFNFNVPALQARCEQCNSSPLEFIKAAWASLLRCYTGSEEVLFASIGSSTGEGLKPWTNTSLCRAKLGLGDAILSAMNKMQQVGVDESASSTSLSDALSAFATLEPKPFNSAIWQRHSSCHLTGEASDDRILELSKHAMVCLLPDCC
ncbi:hypothetical protein BDU57DRAFT_564891 [Ampelomyces quisqualis]|uniref:Uncharacterized protein n=1 Tax=Ampelomyces quisqualis TaxID=50730 RepID=A0A6A5Q9U5_AMPQU|nr:hypothetical protein BDU57DRAFT_564891 [Ampelomyces quisqualis]